MKITILGTGCIWTKRACASYLIDDNILVDCGQGTLKQLLKSNENLLHHEKIEKMSLFLITHYHLDHYFDIASFMWKLASDKFPSSYATIICPPGGEERIKALCRLGMTDSSYEKLNFEKYITFVDCSTMGKFCYKNYEIESVKVEHGAIDAYGYMVKDTLSGKVVSFSGDTAMCDNVMHMIEHSDTAFLDMAGTDITDKHYNIIDGIKLMKKYRGKCTIIPAHLTSQAYDYCMGKINVPRDLDVIDIDSPLPYDYTLKGDESNIMGGDDFEFASDDFAIIKGKIVNLVLSGTKMHGSEYRTPTYIYDVVLSKDNTSVGRVTYSFLPPDAKGHYSNVSMTFKRDFDLKSVEYECCTLIKKVALHHGAKWLYLTCDPKDFSTRMVFSKLGTSLKEIKTKTMKDKDNARTIEESCIWIWELKNGK